MKQSRLAYVLTVVAALAVPTLGLAQPVVPFGAADALAMEVFGSLEVPTVAAPGSFITGGVIWAPEPLGGGPEPLLAVTFVQPVPPPPAPPVPLNTLPPLGSVWEAWLLEPGTGLVSDLIRVSVEPDTVIPGNKSLVAILRSDPFGLAPTLCPNPAKCVTENGTFQDMTSYLAAGAPINLFPSGIRVYAFSDTDIMAAPIPEPETYAMLLAGLGVLGFAARRRKQQAT